jgi:hypothetical protein
MTDDRVRTPRTLFIADHIWDSFARMANEMGSERDGLINQALFMFARLNGYLSPGEVVRTGGAAQSQSVSPPQMVASSMPANKRMTAPLDNRLVTITPASAFPAPNAAEVIGAQRAQANPDRVAELERQLNGAGAQQARVSQPPPAGPARGSVEIDDSLLGDDMGAAQATSMELPNLAELGIAPRKPHPAPPTPDRSVKGEKVLVLMAEGRELDRVQKDRFLIGRGKHCDLIINSGKVSREHAAISREGGEFFIEDLGSSNGTWYDKRRITRRQIEDGDEYYICAEKLSCVFR